MRPALRNCGPSTGWIGFTRAVRTATFAIVAVVTIAGAGSAPALAQQIATQQGSVPLSFGMSADQAAQALGVPLNYVRGRPGNELLVALPNVKGSALASRSDGLYLQFRRGKLAGWKGDWGTIRP
jgi:hypothetical protein